MDEIGFSHTPTINLAIYGLNPLEFAKKYNYLIIFLSQKKKKHFYNFSMIYVKLGSSAMNGCNNSN